MNFKGSYGRPVARNNSFTDKELDKLRNDKNELEIELNSLRDKYEDR